MKTFPNPSIATSAVKSSNLLISHQCPQCGAPAILEEADRLFTCAYCRVRSCLLQNDYFRYLFPGPHSENNDLIFFPYWRFKGTVFSCVSDGIRHRFIDVSHQALPSQCFPVSIGLRSQALKMQFVLPESSGRFIPPHLPFSSVLPVFEDRLKATLPKPVFHQAFIGDSFSLIYSPFFIKDKVYDGLLNQPVSSEPPEDLDAWLSSAKPPSKNIRFVPALCPSCGWDLDGHRNSMIFTCKNCHSVWRTDKNGLKKMKFAFIYEPGDNIIYLPFWRITADIEGIRLQSYADLVKLANLPKACQNNWKDIPFSFWVPGFKVRPQTFIRISQDITLGQPNEKLIRELPDAAVHPVTLPVEEAVQSLKIHLAGFMKPRKLLSSMLEEIIIKPKTDLLVYIPFLQTAHELIQPRFQLALNKNQLALAWNL